MWRQQSRANAVPPSASKSENQTAPEWDTISTANIKRHAAEAKVRQPLKSRTVFSPLTSGIIRQPSKTPSNLEKTFQDETFKKEYLEQQFLVNQKMQEIGDVTIKVNSKTEKSTEEKYQDLLNKKKEQDRLAEEREKKQKQEIEKTKKRDRGFGIGD